MGYSSIEPRILSWFADAGFRRRQKYSATGFILSGATNTDCRLLPRHDDSGSKNRKFDSSAVARGWGRSEGRCHTSWRGNLVLSNLPVRGHNNTTQ
jgi:hypothetical protein